VRGPEQAGIRDGCAAARVVIDNYPEQVENGRCNNPEDANATGKVPFSKVLYRADDFAKIRRRGIIGFRQE
jgi:hypothetical protein